MALLCLLRLYLPAVGCGQGGSMSKVLYFMGSLDGSLQDMLGTGYQEMACTSSQSPLTQKAMALVKPWQT